MDKLHTYMTLKIITCRKEFEQYKEKWSAILESVHNTNPFIEFDWINEWWKYFGENIAVEIIAVKRGDELIAFFPFQCVKKSFVYRYQFLGLGEANYMDIIAKKSDLQISIAFVMEELIRMKKHVVFYFYGLLESNRTAVILKEHLISHRYKYSSHRVITPFINLKAIKLEKYMKKRQRLHRLDRREKRLYENGDITLAKCPPKEMDYIFYLHDKTWEKRYDTSSFTHPQGKGFFKALASLRDGPMQVEIDALYLHDKIIAFNYGFNCRGRVLGYVLGYDDNFEIFSPGRLLEKKKIIHCKNRHDEIFDLSIGYEPYKFDWNTEVDHTEKVIYSSTSLLAKWTRLLLSSKESFIEKTKQNYRIVLFKRNKVGKFLFHVKECMNKDRSEWLKTSKNLFHVLRSQVYNHQKFMVYQINRQDIPNVVQKPAFVELTLNDAISHKKISEKHMKVISRKIYGGYKGYYPKGSLTFEQIIWTNEKVLRIDEIAYLDQFKKSSIFIKNWSHYYLNDVCAMFKEKSNARLFFVYVEERDSKKRKVLGEFGFTPIRQIQAKTVLGLKRQFVVGSESNCL